ncbi:hypothetical protein RRG08_046549 [Elysia crispata]|uniref:Uncharacterized protein n=1 Tax=Elysia crispata TaxID=231223 RepID=A0AAE1DBQ9_9GAST|nr:hypothetical protein RRG08_046549 [Elysia crispata]
MLGKLKARVSPRSEAMMRVTVPSWNPKAQEPTPSGRTLQCYRLAGGGSGKKNHRGEHSSPGSEQIFLQEETRLKRRRLPLLTM